MSQFGQIYWCIPSYGLSCTLLIKHETCMSVLLNIHIKGACLKGALVEFVNDSPVGLLDAEHSKQEYLSVSPVLVVSNFVLLAQCALRRPVELCARDFSLSDISEKGGLRCALGFIPEAVSLSHLRLDLHAECCEWRVPHSCSLVDYGLTFFIFNSTLWLMDLTASYAFQLWTNKLRQCVFPFDSEVSFLKISFWFSLCDLSASLCLCCVNTSWMFKLASGYSILWQYLFVAVSSSAVFYPLAAVDVGSGCLEWNCLKSSLKKQWVHCWRW